MLNPDGRAVWNSSTSKWEYEYDVKDHLGNTRASFGINDKVKVLQTRDYYPFGLEQASWYVNDANASKFRYNGKELQDEEVAGSSLGWYDYGARFYDPQLGRWHVIDPAIEDAHHDYTPYAYVYNNPIRFIDPFGRDSTETNTNSLHAFLNQLFAGARHGNTFKFDDNNNASQYTGTGKNSQYNDASSGRDGEYATFGAIALGLGAVDGPLPIGDAVALGIGTFILADKMAGEISRISAKVNNSRGFVYELRVNQPGTYINVRGIPTQVNAGDVWKYGETTKGFGRYSQRTLGNMIPGGVTMVPIFHGNVIEIKIQEKIMIYGYSMMNGHLPPGNKIYR